MTQWSPCLVRVPKGIAFVFRACTKPTSLKCHGRLFLLFLVNRWQVRVAARASSFYPLPKRNKETSHCRQARFLKEQLISQIRGCYFWQVWVIFMCSTKTPNRLLAPVRAFQALPPPVPPVTPTTPPPQVFEASGAPWPWWSAWRPRSCWRMGTPRTSWRAGGPDLRSPRIPRCLGGQEGWRGVDGCLAFLFEVFLKGTPRGTPTRTGCQACRAGVVFVAKSFLCVLAQRETKRNTTKP